MDDLSEFETASTTPGPTPAIVERARELVSKGTTSADQTDPLADLPLHSRVGFVAHLMSGATWYHTYTVFGDKKLVFRTISAEEDRALSLVAVLQERRGDLGATPDNRAARIIAYSRLAAFSEFEGVYGIPPCKTAEAWLTEIEAFLGRIPAALRTVIAIYGAQFLDLRDVLILKSGEPSFWPAP